ncbi:MAG: DUF4433 domain-containing protein [Bradymonadaceae bacterium]|nr:DUF4433 domain-containing protein [Lujinxingiaceae bacterium]
MTLILHITNISNLENILVNGGLWSINQMPATLTPHSSAHASIQLRRAQTKVPLNRGGFLHDYVPFYFGERSPMLYANHTGTVVGSNNGQNSIIYLVSSVQTVASFTNDWVFTDGHAIMVPLTSFFDDLAHLNQIDWKAVRATYWADTNDDPDRKRRKQAEFLVHQFVPFSWFTEFAVLNQEVAQQVQSILANANAALPVKVRRDWYY